MVQLPEPASVSSTRRFWAWPSAVSFDATGSASPNPCAEIKPGLTPCEIMNCITLSALFCDSTKLLVISSAQSYYRKLWIDDVMKKAAYPSA